MVRNTTRRPHGRSLRSCRRRRELVSPLVAGRRLPQLDAMALRIGDPGEAPVLVLVALVGDLDALGPKRYKQRVEVVDAVVDHERGLPGAEVRRVLLEE